jgi:hypothetical protein
MSKSLSKSVLRFGRRALLVVPVFFVGETCTKLTEVPHNALTTSSAFHTPQEVLAGVAGVYAQMRATESNGEFASMEDLSTDASVVPTRGSDWYDNGQWLDIHRQIWGANTAGALSFLTGSWNDMFSGVAKANLMISVLQSSTAANKDSIIAELRTLRAWYYYMLQDMFGGVPLVTSTELKQVARSTRPQVFAFIESELTDALPNLPDSWPAASYGRVTKGVANAILASLYINAGVFDKPCGPEDCTASINPSGYNSCAGITVKGGIDACTAALNAANAVINSGGATPTYQLSADWYSNFSPTNKSSKENIFVVVHSASTQAIGGDWPMRTLHYNQLNTGDGSPWNGFATTAEYYAQFPANDNRINMWLVGQAKSFEPSTLGQPVNDRNKNPLIFTQQIPDLTKANEGNGIRFNKFNPIPDPPHGSAQPNDFTWFRLAEMYLIRAEAENELGTGDPVADINMVHNLHQSTPVSVTGKTNIRNAILTERALEFAGEGKRRTDLIRFGGFLNWTENSANGVCGADPTKGCPPRDGHRIVFPISINSMGSNPLLVQNAGY